MDAQARPAAVNARISKLLNSSFGDTASAIDALNTLSRFDLVDDAYGSLSSSNGDIFGSGGDGGTPTNLTVNAVNLRRKVDVKLAQGAKAFLVAFEDVNQVCLHPSPGRH